MLSESRALERSPGCSMLILLLYRENLGSKCAVRGPSCGPSWCAPFLPPHRWALPRRGNDKIVRQSAIFERQERAPIGSPPTRFMHRGIAVLVAHDKIVLCLNQKTINTMSCSYNLQRR